VEGCDYGIGHFSIVAFFSKGFRKMGLLSIALVMVIGFLFL
jgi:hypothetical protein